MMFYYSNCPPTSSNLCLDILYILCMSKFFYLLILCFYMLQEDIKAYASCVGCALLSNSINLHFPVTSDPNHTNASSSNACEMIKELCLPLLSEKSMLSKPLGNPANCGVRRVDCQSKTCETSL